MDLIFGIFLVILIGYLLYKVYINTTAPYYPSLIWVKTGYIPNENITVYIVDYALDKNIAPAFSIPYYNEIYIQKDFKAKGYVLRVEYCNLKNIGRLKSEFVTDIYCNFIGWVFYRPKVVWNWTNEYYTLFGK